MVDDEPNYPRLAEVVKGLDLHEHLCLIYNSREQQFATALPYLRTGLERGERCLYIVDENTAAVVLQGLRKSGTDVDHYLRTGALIIADKQVTYLKQGRFDPDSMIAFLTQANVEAGADGFSAMRTVLGEMTWALAMSTGTDRLIEYESKLNLFVRDHDARVICQYNRARFSPELILGVIRTHPLVVYGDLVCKNPFYIPPEEFLKPNHASQEVERLLNNILRTEQAEQALRHSEEALQVVIDTIPMMVWSVRPDGVVDFLNRRWMDYSGLSLEQYVENPMGPMHPEDIPRVMEKWRADMAAGEPYEDEMRLRRADGEYRWFLIRTAPLRDEQGNIVKWYGSSIDIEDRKRAEEDLRRLSGQLLRSQDEERRRIARELHDSTGQDLVALATMLGQLQSSLPPEERKSRRLLSEIKDLADRCLRDVRTLAYVLYPPGLDVAGLEDAIRDYVAGFTKRTGIRVGLDLSPRLGRMAQNVELALFRVVQEALTNIQRHSGSRQAKIRIYRNVNLTLEISDRGREVSAKVPRGREPRPLEVGVGIRSMEERAKLIGARFEIDSNSYGTTVRVILPLGGLET